MSCTTTHGPPRHLSCSVLRIQQGGLRDWPGWRHVGALLDDIAADIYEQVRLAYQFDKPEAEAPAASGGEGAVIGGNTWVIESVRPGERVLNTRMRCAGCYRAGFKRTRTFWVPTARNLTDTLAWLMRPL